MSSGEAPVSRLTELEGLVEEVKEDCDNLEMDYERMAAQMRVLLEELRIRVPEVRSQIPVDLIPKMSIREMSLRSHESFADYLLRLQNRRESSPNS